MDPMRRDVVRATAGVMHREAHRSLTHEEAGARHERSPRTHRYWLVQGPPSAPTWVKYLERCPDPYHVAMWGVAQAKRLTVEKLSDADLRERIRDLIAVEKSLEAEDSVGDVRAVGWLEDATTIQRELAINAEKFACWMEAAARRFDMREVLHG